LQSFSVQAQESTPEDLFFKPDGTKLYIVGSFGDDINEYNLSTPWDISTASFLQLFSVVRQDSVPTGLFFKPDGTKLYVVGTINGKVREYDLSTAWNISTASYTYPSTNYFSVAAQEISPEDLFFKPDGTKLYVLGSIGDDINEYNLSTAWDISTASFLRLFSVAAQDSAPTGLFFKPDGTKLYVVGTTGDAVYEYNLSTPWNISTASFLQSFSVAAQEATPSGLFFKPDGTKVYVLGSVGRNINEYNLSTAWDISTASFLQSFSVAAQEATPSGLFFKPDGTRVYIIGLSGDEINEYILPNAWDISTASFLRLFSVAAQESAPRGLFFNPDGTKVYIIGTGDAGIWSYDL
jgi:DNA-binding beta-propeller fold protein YncE